MSPWIPIAIVVALVAAYVTFRLVRNVWVTKAFEDASATVRLLSPRMQRRKLERDHGDVVLTGTIHETPVTIRWSRSEYAPAILISCAAPSPLVVSLASRDHSSPGGSKIFRTGDASLDLRLVARTDHPAYARMFCDLPHVNEHLRALCNSTGTMVLIAEHKVQFSQDVENDEPGARTVNCVESVLQIARALENLPGARAARPAPEAQRTSVLIAAGVAAVALIAVFVLVLQRSTTEASGASAGAAQPPMAIAAGIPQENAHLIPDLSGWKLMDPAQTDPSFAEWARIQGFDTGSKMALDVNGAGAKSGAAYVFSSGTDSHVKRVVLIAGGKSLCDIIGPAEGAVRVPKPAVARFNGADPEAPTLAADGDALLLVRNRTKGQMTLFYLAGGQLHSENVPADTFGE